MGKALTSEEITVRCVQHIAIKLSHSDRRISTMRH